MVKDWIKFTGSAGDDYGRSLSLDINGNLFVVGSMSQQGASNGGSDIVLIGLFTNGTTNFIYNIGSTNDEDPISIDYIKVDE